ncbi:MAG: D-alanyl-D-alanine carboxypeptidase [Hyphomicrobium sp.]|nr:D-alanyl-D-alanine carboxypeptidase [Hyphomicrobium sp.]PPD07530.1 MAG: D-alanyl-D-alanine carboxypeptidase [Hyphomicrobium sp.]
MFLAGAFCALLLAATPASAGEKSAAMVIDANTGRVLHDNAGSEPRYPASLTKMMTLYLAFETIEAGRLSFSTPLTVSERAAAAAPSKLGLEAGSEIALRDAIKALIVKSANDMAVAIAEKIGGSEAGFAKLMTKRARQLGMRDTTFQNASGLPDPDQVTTARDMLTLAMRLQDDFPQHYRMFSTRTFSYGGKTYRSHNALLGRFAGVDGIKTGYTRASGFNLVSSYKTGGKHVVAAVFGGVSAGLRDAHMRMLLARAIEKASTERTRKAGPQLIAEAKPAKRPAPKPVVKPQPAAPVEPAIVAEAPMAVEPSASIAQKIAAADAAPGPKIAIAKVKTVSVLQPTSLQSDRQPVVAETAATPVAPQPLTYAATMPRPDFAALKAQIAARAGGDPAPAEMGRASDGVTSVAPSATSPPANTETVLAKASDLGRAPSTLQAQLARLSEPSDGFSGDEQAAMKPALQAVVADLPAPTPVPVSLGRSRPGVEAVDGPASRPTPSAPGYHVQIGVYGSPTEAERAMSAAKSKAAHVLAESAPIAVPLTKGDRQLYRARFAGFDSASATSACNELRRNGLDCFVARAN